MNPIRELAKALRFTIVMWLLVAVIYPFLMLVVGQGLFSAQANGSLIYGANGQVIGSSLIGQPFSSERYFKSRPSAINFSVADPKDALQAKILKTGISGASNFAPGDKALFERIGVKFDASGEKIYGDFPRLKQAGISPTADLIYASGSGLDPHITPAAAKAQIASLSQTRQISPEKLESLIQENTDGRFLGIFGEDGVNVLKLNLALDRAKP